MNRELTIKQLAFVSALIGPAKGNATEAARIAGYKGNEKTLTVVAAQNLVKPSIQIAISAYRDKVEQQGIASLQTRVDGYDERREQFLAIVRDRGWMAKTTKMIGSGDNAEKIVEESFDAALAKALLDVEKQAAQDLGQWSEKREISNPDGQTIQIVAMRIVHPE